MTSTTTWQMDFEESVGFRFEITKLRNYNLPNPSAYQLT
jgi:hypothetical protein